MHVNRGRERKHCQRTIQDNLTSRVMPSLIEMYAWIYGRKEWLGFLWKWNWVGGRKVFYSYDTNQFYTTIQVYRLGYTADNDGGDQSCWKFNIPFQGLKKFSRALCWLSISIVVAVLLVIMAWQGSSHTVRRFDGSTPPLQPHWHLVRDKGGCLFDTLKMPLSCLEMPLPSLTTHTPPADKWSNGK